MGMSINVLYLSVLIRLVVPTSENKSNTDKESTLLDKHESLKGVIGNLYLWTAPRNMSVFIVSLLASLSSFL